MNWRWKLYPAAAAILLLVATTAVPAQEATNRPAGWAQKLEVAGIQNCYRVTTSLYRGAQPTAQGMTRLKAMGVKTVVNLRAWHSDKDKETGTGLKSVRFEMDPWRGDTEEVIQFLKVVTDTNNLPAFVHCKRGADRTGMMCAMYRIAVCGWTKPEAIAEMKKGGFGFNPVWQNLVRFVDKADVADIKRRAGLPEKQ
jgi:protein tyrosine/serine phosphatase